MTSVADVLNAGDQWSAIETAPRDGSLVILRTAGGEECGWPALWSTSFHFPCWYQEVGGVSDDKDWAEWRPYVHATDNPFRARTAAQQAASTLSGGA